MITSCMWSIFSKCVFALIFMTSAKRFIAAFEHFYYISGG